MAIGWQGTSYADRKRYCTTWREGKGGGEAAIFPEIRLDKQDHVNVDLVCSSATFISRPSLFNSSSPENSS